MVRYRSRPTLHLPDDVLTGLIHPHGPRTGGICEIHDAKIADAARSFTNDHGSQYYDQSIPQVCGDHGGDDRRPTFNENGLNPAFGKHGEHLGEVQPTGFGLGDHNNNRAVALEIGSPLSCVSGGCEQERRHLAGRLNQRRRCRRPHLGIYDYTQW